MREIPKRYLQAIIMKDCTGNGYWPDYPRITLAALAEFKQDDNSKQRFDWRFAPSLLFGFLVIGVLMGGAPMLYDAKLIDGLAFSAAYLCALIFAFVYGGHRQKTMVRTRPISASSGLEMEPFIIQDLETPSHYELAYIDRQSGMYFRRTHAETSS